MPRLPPFARHLKGFLKLCLDLLQLLASESLRLRARNWSRTASTEHGLASCLAPVLHKLVLNVQRGYCNHSLIFLNPLVLALGFRV